MDTSIYVASAAQRTLQRQLVTIANNIANSNTVGFRAESVEFHSLVSRSGPDPVHYPTMGKIHPSLQNGELKNTGNPLDIALSGDGWFAIATPAGTAFTRDGRLEINAFGELQTLEGNAILDSSEAPIIIPTGDGMPTIHNDGRIIINENVVGNIGVFSVPKNSLSQRYSNSSFLSAAQGIPVSIGTTTSIQQGYVESSNVNPLRELVNLISVSRSFESSTSIVEKADSAISKSINELAEN